MSEVGEKGHKFGPTTAISIVVANMIGTGVFTSLGFQLLDIQSAPVIIALWVTGAILAFCGALCYAEIGAALPRSAGEYNYVGQIYHPGLGFVAGWISATVGFAAPTALAAMTAGAYAQAVNADLSSTLVAIILVIVTVLVHLTTRQRSARYQLVFTGLKVLLIVFFIVSAIALVELPQDLRWLPVSADADIMLSGSVAIALIYVTYAYTGWNAATYLAGEIESPERNLPRVLLLGTTVVAVIYVALNAMFLYVAPMSAMAGEVEVGFIVAGYAYGDLGRQIVAAMLAVLLISTVSAMLLAGPRALQVVGQDFSVLGFLAQENRQGIPQTAICVQGGVTLLLVLTATFQAVLVFASFVLALNTLLTVAGVWVLRRRSPDLARPFRVPWYPLPMIIYIAITLWTLVYVALQEPAEVLVAAGLVASGWLFYMLSRDRVNA